ncbi:hypothetical protein VYU27_006907 [Nannochloropsis oceanica]
MPQLCRPVKAEASSSVSTELFSSRSTSQYSSTTTTTNPPPSGITFAALTPLISFSILLGVVMDDVIIDFCENAEWKKAYLAAHRTATLPTSAFVPLACVLGFGGFVYNIYVNNLSSSRSGCKIHSSEGSSINASGCTSEEKVITTMDGKNKRRCSSRRKPSSNTSTKNAVIYTDSTSLHTPISPSIHAPLSNTRQCSSPSPLLDWRILISTGLGLLMYVLFVHFLIPSQDFIAGVVVSDKSRLRSAGQVQEALRLVKGGHLLLFGALTGMVALQVSLLGHGGLSKWRNRQVENE